VPSIYVTIHRKDFESMPNFLLIKGLCLSNRCKKEIRHILSEEGDRADKFIKGWCNIINWFKEMKNPITDETAISGRQLERIQTLSVEFARILENMEKNTFYTLFTNYQTARLEIERAVLDLDIKIPKTDDEIFYFAKDFFLNLIQHLKLHGHMIERRKELISDFKNLFPITKRSGKGSPGLSDELIVMLRFGMLSFSKSVKKYKISSSENSPFHKVMLIAAQDIGIKNKYGKPYQSLKDAIKIMMNDRVTERLIKG
jgi:hypothetical protein